MIELLKKQLVEANNIVMIGHKNPDGDAVGSTSALSGVLRGMGKETHIIFPNGCPEYLSWIDGVQDAIIYENDKEKADAVLAKAGLVVMLDFNALSRLDELGDAIPDIPMAMIDHHPFPDLDTPLLFSDTSVSSTCELLTSLLYEMGFEEYITKDAGTALFVGIMTDTGRFNHNSSNPQTYRMVANLLERGVDKDAVFERIFDCFSETRMRLMGYIMHEKMQIFREQGISIITLSLEEKERFNCQPGDAEGFVNYPLSIVGVERSIFLQEYDDKIRMSFRSKDIPVNDIAAEHFNGGGHAKAAGGASFESLEDTVNKVKEVFGITG